MPNELVFLIMYITAGIVLFVVFHTFFSGIARLYSKWENYRRRRMEKENKK